MSVTTVANWDFTEVEMVEVRQLVRNDRASIVEIIANCAHRRALAWGEKERNRFDRLLRKHEAMLAFIDEREGLEKIREIWLAVAAPEVTP